MAALSLGRTNKSDLRPLDIVTDRLFAKLSKTNNMTTARKCQQFKKVLVLSSVTVVIRAAKYVSYHNYLSVRAACSVYDTIRYEMLF